MEGGKKSGSMVTEQPSMLLLSVTMRRVKTSRLSGDGDWLTIHFRFSVTASISLR